MKDFAKRFKKGQRVLDIGCGRSPYKKYFTCSYIGVDPFPTVKPDIIANAWDIPLKDNTFDGIILNQSLEHIAETSATVKEIYRLLKPGGYVMVTAPHTVRDHSIAIPAKEAPVHNFNPSEHPFWRVDYYRFTKFGLMYLFKDFTVVSIIPTTGYFGSLLQLISLFFASLGIKYIFAPLYFINNILALVIDTLFTALGSLRHPLFTKFYHQTYTSLTMNYICVFQKP